MGIAMVLVVLFHQNYENEGILWDIFHRYGYWGADIFLFISGMGIVNSLETHTIRRYYMNRCWRILPACIINGVVTIMFKIVSKDVVDSSQFPIWFYLTSMIYWYITAIIVYYILAPFVLLCLKKSGWFFLVIVTLLSLLYIYNIYQFLIPYYFTYRWYVEMTVVHIPVFIFGMYVGIHDVKSKVSFLFLSSMAFVAAVIITENVGGIINLVGTGYKFVLIMGAMPFLILMMNWGGHFCPAKLKRCIEWVGYRTLEIYLLHVIVFGMINDFCDNYNNHIQFIIAILLSLLMAYILQQMTHFIRISIEKS